MLPLKIAAISENIALSGILLSTFGIAAVFLSITYRSAFDKIRRETMMLYGMGSVSIALFILSFSIA
ncbi:hypothetical protein KHA80_20970 [Anaerobacillus sp. HL2]|nr:hypothetical protein KHA80_20970 [Anaerobacillus sp. HL2]